MLGKYLELNTTLLCYCATKTVIMKRDSHLVTNKLSDMIYKHLAAVIFYSHRLTNYADLENR